MFGQNPAMTYSRPRRTTIGPGCLTAVFGMGTGGTIRVCSPRRHTTRLIHRFDLSFREREPINQSSSCIKKAAVGNCFTLQDPSHIGALGRGSEKRINAAKRLAVSTGQLRRLRALHVRPIDLVVFQEPLSRRTGDLVLRGVSRLDAFSVYPGRT